jgi:conserved oligomeric Golgi complex subunit 6
VLLAEKAQVESKQNILEAFKDHFVVSDADATILTSTAEPVNDQFFQILTRVKKIHRDCQVLLGTENQQLGLEILEQSSKQLNAAFQKLYRWIQREFKRLDLENPQINASIRRSLRVLAERPSLFQSCLDSFAETREHILSDSFYTALTGSSESLPSAKPIEFYAHDPLRYVGDMLAWAHSATVSEREALEVLFISEGDEIAKSIREGLESEPWLTVTEDDDDEDEDDADESKRKQPAQFDGRKALADLVSRDLTGVARLLRSRIEQVVQSHDDATLSYKIANLINFYRSTFTKLLGHPSSQSQPQQQNQQTSSFSSSSPPSLLITLANLETAALSHFQTTMSDHAHAVLPASDIAPPASLAPPDLSPPPFLTEELTTLKSLLKDYDTSLASTVAMSSQQNQEGSRTFEPILAVSLDPYVKACGNVSKVLLEPDADVFLVNCILEILGVLRGGGGNGGYEAFTGYKIKELEETMKECEERLISFLHRWFLDWSKVGLLVFALGELVDTEQASKEHGEDDDSKDEEETEMTEDENNRRRIRAIPSLPQFSPDSLVKISQALDEFLPSALMDATENIKRLRNTKMVQEITEEAAERFCLDFEFVEGRILEADALMEEEAAHEDKENEEEDERPRMRELFQRTSAEIRVLLS